MDLGVSLGSSGGGLETVYGTHEDSHVVMSEKVQSLAGSIYQEFERMIARYDEDVVKTLMPLLVNVLECLDAAYQQNQEHDVELELLREDNEQLVTQYEREKSARKASEQKLLELEDSAEGERKEMCARLEALESIVRMLEIKHKNSMEHASRLEEREAELKKEYAKLHDRYTELFKTHMDSVERTKLLLSGHERADVSRLGTSQNSHSGRMQNLNLGRSSGPVSFGFASLENAEVVDSVPASPISSSARSSPSLHSELDNVKDSMQIAEKSQVSDAIELENNSVVTSPVTGQSSNSSNANKVNSSRLHTKKEQRSANTLYQELSFQDVDGDEDADITGGWVHPGEYASSVNDNFYGMGKEVENLIMENNELLATKNALNVVKDDLIVKVDELTGEVEILREEIVSLNLSRSKLRKQIQDLEEELRKIKEVNESKQEGGDEESDVPMAQRKRFTRVEMARVLMERNQYKERLIELQEAVRWTEMIRATRTDADLDKKSKSIWKFFSRLFVSSERQQKPPTTAHLRYQTATNQIAPGVRQISRHDQDATETELGLQKLGIHEKLAFLHSVERPKQYSQIKAHVSKETSGRLQAYGWSLPARTNATKLPKNASYVQPSSAGVSVPVPVYCRPLQETAPGMKIWCAAGVNIMGGYTKDGGLMVGGSVFYSEPSKLNMDLPGPPPNDDIESLSAELKEWRECSELETKLSSLVWISTYTDAASIVTVINANHPGDLLNSFGVCTSHILCMASVPGASPSDYEKTFAKLNQGVDDAKADMSVPIDHTNQHIPSDAPTTTDTVNDYPDAEVSTSHIENSGLDAKPIQNDDNSDGLKEGERDDSTQSSAHLNNKMSDKKQEELNEMAVVGKLVFIKNDPSVINKRDKYNERKSPVQLQSPYDDNADTTEEMSQCDGDGSERENCKSEIQYSTNRNETEDADESSQSSSDIKREVMSSVLATMWMGAENGMLYVHSTVANWNQCLHSVKLKDAVTSIVHLSGRVVVALACGALAIFCRGSDGEWDLANYCLIQVGLPDWSVRCLSVVGNKVWCGIRNRIRVVSPLQLKVIHTLEAHPRRESIVRQIAWFGDGVWVSIRLDSTLRLFHAHTYRHLHDVDVDPYVSKMLGGGKVGFSFVRISALLISSGRLWIGTSNGVIISVPLKNKLGNRLITKVSAVEAHRFSTSLVPDGKTNSLVVESSTSATTDQSGAESAIEYGFMPYCSMEHAQLSFHGHKESVRFFVAVPGTGGMSAASTPSEAMSASIHSINEISHHSVAPTLPAPLSHHQSLPTTPVSAKPPPMLSSATTPTVHHSKPDAMLVISGGEGYVDFRNSTDDMIESLIVPANEAPNPSGDTEANATANGNANDSVQCHLLVWRVSN